MALAMLVFLPAHLEVASCSIQLRLLPCHPQLGFIDVPLNPMNVRLDPRAITFQGSNLTFRVREKPLGVIVIRVGVVLDTADVLTG